MARTVSDGGDAADRFRRAQRGLMNLLSRDMRRLRRLIRPARLQQTIPEWIDAAGTVIDRYGAASATLAADFYDAQREASGVAGRFTAPLAEAPPREQIEASLRWAAKDLWPRQEERATVAQLQPMPVRLEQAAHKAEGAAQKLALDQGRETVREAVQRDPRAIGYARAAALGACSFCKLMASRGAVYKDFESVGGAANERFEGDASVVKFHDNCHCQPIPIFRGDTFELSPQAAEWDRLYFEYAAGHPGEQLARFRRALAEHDENPLPGSR